MIILFKYKKLLIDGSFYNLGYFYRLQILVTAIKNENMEESLVIHGILTKPFVGIH